MLRVQDLRVDYERVRAVRGLSLTVNEGEAVGVVGPNGAGKSTTLSVIAGMKRPTNGVVSFEGKDITGLSPERVVRLGVSLVPEGRHIFGRLTVYENLRLGATIRGLSAARGDIDRLLERFPVLQTYLHSPAGRLSGGEQQQLAIARALLSRPKLLLLDEPSMGLSPLMVELLFEILGELHDDGVTILLVEQNVRKTIEFADRTYILANGVIDTEGPRETLLDERVEQAYFGTDMAGSR